MEQSGKRSPQSEFWNIGEIGRKGGKKVVTHSSAQLGIFDKRPMAGDLRHDPFLGGGLCKVLSFHSVLDSLHKHTGFL